MWGMHVIAANTNYIHVTSTAFCLPASHRAIRIRYVIRCQVSEKSLINSQVLMQGCLLGIAAADTASEVTGAGLGRLHGRRH